MIHCAVKSAIHREQCWMTLNAVFFYNRKVTNLQEGSHGKNNFVYYCYYKAK